MSIQLSEYNEKRNFEKTAEPEGRTGNDEEQLRFALHCL